MKKEIQTEGMQVGRL